jgi:hypothetical protein
MGRYDLKHVDKGIIYLPIQNSISNTEINNLIAEHKSTGKTVVLLRSGKQDIKDVFKELIKTRLNT